MLCALEGSLCNHLKAIRTTFPDFSNFYQNTAPHLLAMTTITGAFTKSYVLLYVSVVLLHILFVVLHLLVVVLDVLVVVLHVLVVVLHALVVADLHVLVVVPNT